MEKVDRKYMDERFIETGGSVPCFFLCAVLFLVLGIVPIIPEILVRLLKPFFLVICIIFPGLGYYRRGYEKYLVYLMIHLFFIWILNMSTFRGIGNYVSVLLFSLFFLIAGLRIWTPYEIRMILRTVAFAGVLCAVIILASNGTLFRANGSQHLNFIRIVVNRNMIAFAIVPGTISSLLLCLFIKRNIVARIRYLFSYLFCFFTLTAISCRSAFLSAVTGSFLIIWERITQKNTARRIFHRSLFLFFVYVVLLVSMKILEDTNSARLFDYSETGRDELWEEAVELIKAKPLLGGGFDYWERTGHKMSPHSTFLSITLISGIVGGIILGIMILALVLECLRVHSAIALAFAMEMIFHTITESGLDYYAYIPLILTSILLHYLEYQHKDLSSLFY